MDHHTDIDEETLARLIALFYARVREDPEIGPIFTRAIHDWSDHEAKLVDFWHSVMLTSGRYKGNPMLAHMRQKAIRPEHFDRWLALWKMTTEDVTRPATAAALQQKAGRIAESLKLGMFFRPEAIAPDEKRQ